MDVSRQHGLKYETAWTWLHKLRSSLSQFGRAPLDGSVEVDETYSAERTTTLIRGAASPGTRRRSPLTPERLPWAACRP